MNTGIWLSGLGGSVITVVIERAVDIVRYYYRRRTIRHAIKSECEYNLGIVEEMLGGMVNANGTFKRMSVEFFKETRIQSLQYDLGKDVIKQLSNLIIDLELYNREADCCFGDGSEPVVYAGAIGRDDVCLMKKSNSPNLEKTVTAACQGVKNSLNAVIDAVSN